MASDQWNDFYHAPYPDEDDDWYYEESECLDDPPPPPPPPQHQSTMLHYPSYAQPAPQPKVRYDRSQISYTTWQNPWQSSLRYQEQQNQQRQQNQQARPAYGYSAWEFREDDEEYASSGMDDVEVDSCHAKPHFFDQDEVSAASEPPAGPSQVVPPPPPPPPPAPAPPEDVMVDPLATPIVIHTSQSPGIMVPSSPSSGKSVHFPEGLEDPKGTSIRNGKKVLNRKASLSNLKEPPKPIIPLVQKREHKGLTWKEQQEKRRQDHEKRREAARQQALKWMEAAKKKKVLDLQQKKEAAEKAKKKKEEDAEKAKKRAEEDAIKAKNKAEEAKRKKELEAEKAKKKAEEAKKKKEFEGKKKEEAKKKAEELRKKLAAKKSALKKPKTKDVNVDESIGGGDATADEGDVPPQAPDPPAAPEEVTKSVLPSDGPDEESAQVLSPAISACHDADPSADERTNAPAETSLEEQETKALLPFDNCIVESNGANAIHPDQAEGGGGDRLGSLGQGENQEPDGLEDQVVEGEVANSPETAQPNVEVPDDGPANEGSRTNDASKSPFDAGTEIEANDVGETIIEIPGQLSNPETTPIDEDHPQHPQEANEGHGRDISSSTRQEAGNEEIQSPTPADILTDELDVDCPDCAGIVSRSAIQEDNDNQLPKGDLGALEPLLNNQDIPPASGPSQQNFEETVANLGPTEHAHAITGEHKDLVNLSNVPEETLNQQDGDDATEVPREQSPDLDVEPDEIGPGSGAPALPENVENDDDQPAQSLDTPEDSLKGEPIPDSKDGDSNPPLPTLEVGDHPPGEEKGQPAKSDETGDHGVPPPSPMNGSQSESQDSNTAPSPPQEALDEHSAEESGDNKPSGQHEDDSLPPPASDPPNSDSKDHTVDKQSLDDSGESAPDEIQIDQSCHGDDIDSAPQQEDLGKPCPDEAHHTAEPEQCAHDDSGSENSAEDVLKSGEAHAADQGISEGEKLLLGDADWTAQSTKDEHDEAVPPAGPDVHLPETESEQVSEGDRSSSENSEQRGSFEKMSQDVTDTSSKYEPGQDINKVDESADSSKQVDAAESNVDHETLEISHSEERSPEDHEATKDSAAEPSEKQSDDDTTKDYNTGPGHDSQNNSVEPQTDVHASGSLGEKAHETPSSPSAGDEAEDAEAVENINGPLDEQEQEIFSPIAGNEAENVQAQRSDDSEQILSAADAVQDFDPPAFSKESTAEGAESSNASKDLDDQNDAEDAANEANAIKEPAETTGVASTEHDKPQELGDHTVDGSQKLDDESEDAINFEVNLTEEPAEKTKLKSAKYDQPQERGENAADDSKPVDGSVDTGVSKPPDEGGSQDEIKVDEADKVESVHGSTGSTTATSDSQKDADTKEASERDDKPPRSTSDEAKRADSEGSQSSVAETGESQNLEKSSTDKPQETAEQGPGDDSQQQEGPEAELTLPKQNESSDSPPEEIHNDKDAPKTPDTKEDTESTPQEQQTASPPEDAADKPDSDKQSAESVEPVKSADSTESANKQQTTLELASELLSESQEDPPPEEEVSQYTEADYRVMEAIMNPPPPPPPEPEPEHEPESQKQGEDEPVAQQSKSSVQEDRNTGEEQDDSQPAAHGGVADDAGKKAVKCADEVAEHPDLAKSEDLKQGNSKDDSKSSDGDGGDEKPAVKTVAAGHDASDASHPEKADPATEDDKDADIPHMETQSHAMDNSPPEKATAVGTEDKQGEILESETQSQDTTLEKINTDEQRGTKGADGPAASGLAEAVQDDTADDSQPLDDTHPKTEEELASPQDLESDLSEEEDSDLSDTEDGLSVASSMAAAVGGEEGPVSEAGDDGSEADASESQPVQSSEADPLHDEVKADTAGETATESTETAQESECKSGEDAVKLSTQSDSTAAEEPKSNGSQSFEPEVPSPESVEADKAYEKAKVVDSGDAGHVEAVPDGESAVVQGENKNHDNSTAKEVQPEADAADRDLQPVIKNPNEDPSVDETTSSPPEPVNQSSSDPILADNMGDKFPEAAADSEKTSSPVTESSSKSESLEQDSSEDTAPTEQPAEDRDKATPTGQEPVKDDFATSEPQISDIPADKEVISEEVDEPKTEDLASIPKNNVGAITTSVEVVTTKDAPEEPPTASEEKKGETAAKEQPSAGIFSGDGGEDGMQPAADSESKNEEVLEEEFSAATPVESASEDAAITEQETDQRAPTAEQKVDSETTETKDTTLAAAVGVEAMVDVDTPHEDSPDSQKMDTRSENAESPSKAGDRAAGNESASKEPAPNARAGDELPAVENPSPESDVPPEVSSGVQDDSAPTPAEVKIANDAKEQVQDPPPEVPVLEPCKEPQAPPEQHHSEASAKETPLAERIPDRVDELPASPTDAYKHKYRRRPSVSHHDYPYLCRHSTTSTGKGTYTMSSSSRDQPPPSADFRRRSNADKSFRRISISSPEERNYEEGREKKRERRRSHVPADVDEDGERRRRRRERKEREDAEVEEARLKAEQAAAELKIKELAHAERERERSEAKAAMREKRRLEEEALREKRRSEEEALSEKRRLEAEALRREKRRLEDKRLIQEDEKRRRRAEREALEAKEAEEFRRHEMEELEKEEAKKQRKRERRHRERERRVSMTEGDGYPPVIPLREGVEQEPTPPRPRRRRTEDVTKPPAPAPRRQSLIGGLFGLGRSNTEPAVPKAAERSKPRVSEASRRPSNVHRSSSHRKRQRSPSAERRHQERKAERHASKGTASFDDTPALHDPIPEDVPMDVAPEQDSIPMSSSPLQEVVPESVQEPENIPPPLPRATTFADYGRAERVAEPVEPGSSHGGGSSERRKHHHRRRHEHHDGNRERRHHDGDREKRHHHRRKNSAALNELVGEKTEDRGKETDRGDQDRDKTKRRSKVYPEENMRRDIVTESKHRGSGSGRPREKERERERERPKNKGTNGGGGLFGSLKKLVK